MLMVSEVEQGAFFSLYDKTGCEVFARALQERGLKIYSSTGTYRYLREHGIEVTDVVELMPRSFKKMFADVWKLCEQAGIAERFERKLVENYGAILGHRVATLAPWVYAGILARPEIPEDMQLLKERGLPYFDVVRVDLYPLKAAIAKEGATRASVKELTDIGGPNLLRAAAKGERYVICKQEQEARVLASLRGESKEPEAFVRAVLGVDAEICVSQYADTSACYLTSTLKDLLAA